MATKQVTRTPEQSDQVDHLMSCQSREKPGSCPKQKSTNHEDTWLWLKNDSPLRIQNDTYYDICLINMS